MIDKFVPLLDSIFMTVISIGLFITYISFLTAIPIILSTIYWISKLKKTIQKDHDGKFSVWLKWLVKKN
jgi:hypothetical protein